MWSALAVAAACLAYIFFDGFVEMEYRWANVEEYSHGYMIPLVAMFLFYQKIPALVALDWRANWLGPFLMVGAILGWFLGEMSSLFIIVHYSFLLSLVALAISVFGWRGFRKTWAAFVYLVFMIPLPVFLYRGLSERLQLISTEIGVAVIKLFGISVYTTGNVIDLGVYQLQVVEACSGLSYLFPLMSFGFLIAYVYNGPNWHKWTIFLSTIVITILMNSFRIGVIGVTVEYWGIEMAEGFLHDFEGWFVFMACLGVLFLLVLFLNYVIGRKASPLDLIDLSYPTLAEIKAIAPGQRKFNVALITSTILLALALPTSIYIDDREEYTPLRNTFISFPLLRGDWVGKESVLEANILEALDYPDYIQANYRKSGDRIPVNFYVAYYESQRTGSSIHSPRSCIPGGGWKISGLTQVDLAEKGLAGLNVNRLMISKGEHSQLVYYWFAQRGRVITNEYLAKWYLFSDGLTMQRSDGALVRLVTVVPPGEDVANADARLQEFLRDFYPIMPRYLPGADAALSQGIDSSSLAPAAD
ncbi:VPLPA-CTERM-specific exosortase XrtD [Candidatus Litorirhabdus singularis]|uniref:VPLPA-CTERM-specific exosortase XrtD n=1 Tax=Candidatus Litorirhabdus singularis TaxID=2518993 RepID=UPI00242D97CD|nr:VPLPA-CTERM-specific exosortase XrtD [Candidatus Litorirhabdus singularis]